LTVAPRRSISLIRRNDISSLQNIHSSRIRRPVR
jgi:hypothetical protein